ncbi:MAG: TolB-like translocation protein [Thermodesulfovibrionales bacterium]
MKLLQKITIKIALFPIILSFVSCQPEFKTIPGPETKGISKDLNGTLLFDKPVGGLVSISLSSKKEKLIRNPGESSGFVHSVSGPDINGRIAIIENHMENERHLLKIYEMNNDTVSTIFERKGDVLWGDAAGDYLALSPANGYVALVTNTSSVQLRGPDVLLKYGTLEIWDIKTKNKLSIECRALDDRLSWFPDGKHLVFVDLLNQNVANKLYLTKDSTNKRYGKSNLQWPRVPTVSILNIETGDVKHLFIGWSPIVSEDGDAIMMGDHDNNWIIFYLNEAIIKPVYPPGITWFGALHLTHNTVFYWGLPTEGTELKTTENNSPLVGPKPMYTLKVAEFETGKYETVIPYIDPRRKISYGKE